MILILLYIYLNVRKQNNTTLFLIFISRLAEAEAVLVGDDDSPFGSSQGVTIEKVTSEFGDTSAFALQVSI